MLHDESVRFILQRNQRLRIPVDDRGNFYDKRKSASRNKTPINLFVAEFRTEIKFNHFLFIYNFLFILSQQIGSFRYSSHFLKDYELPCQEIRYDDAN